MSHTTSTPDPGQPGRRYSRRMVRRDAHAAMVALDRESAQRMTELRSRFAQDEGALHTPNSPDHADLDPVDVTVHRDPLFHQFIVSIDYTYPDGRVHTVYPSTAFSAAGL